MNKYVITYNAVDLSGNNIKETVSANGIGSHGDVVSFYDDGGVFLVVASSTIDRVELVRTEEEEL